MYQPTASTKRMIRYDKFIGEGHFGIINGSNDVITIKAHPEHLNVTSIIIGTCAIHNSVCNNSENPVSPLVSDKILFSRNPNLFDINSNQYLPCKMNEISIINLHLVQDVIKIVIDVFTPDCRIGSKRRWNQAHFHQQLEVLSIRWKSTFKMIEFLSQYKQNEIMNLNMKMLSISTIY